MRKRYGRNFRPYRFSICPDTRARRAGFNPDFRLFLSRVETPDFPFVYFSFPFFEKKEKIC